MGGTAKRLRLSTLALARAMNGTGYLYGGEQRFQFSFLYYNGIVVLDAVEDDTAHRFTCGATQVTSCLNPQCQLWLQRLLNCITDNGTSTWHLCWNLTRSSKLGAHSRCLAQRPKAYIPNRGAFQTHTFAAHFVPLRTGHPACSEYISSSPSAFCDCRRRTIASEATAATLERQSAAI
eukprot:COSAG02_NODE_1022_length_15153_cov_3.631460_3_plen_178_part_00